MRKKLDKLFDEFMVEYEYSKKLSPETIRGYKNTFQLFKKLMPTTETNTLTKSTVIAFFKELETRDRIVGRNKHVKGVKSSTIATHRSKLHKFCLWLKENNIIKDDPFETMEYPNVKYEDKKFLKSDEINYIFGALYSVGWLNNFVKKRNIAIISTFLFTGLRKSELLGIKFNDIDIERKMLRVDARNSKSKIERYVPINRQLFISLKDYLEERKKLNYKTPYFFVSCNRDDGLKAIGLKHMVERLKEASGVNFHVHRFRHTFAVNLLNQGVDIAKLKQLLGHKDIRMTASYVRCLPPSMLRADLELLIIDNLF